MTVPPIASATLLCPNCGHSTPHRILRLDPASDTSEGGLRGIARCRTCRFTHPFESVPTEEVEVDLIVSSGSRSERRRVRLPRFARLKVGSTVPGGDERVTIRRLDDPSGRSVPHADAHAVPTIWGVLDLGAVVRVSVVEGARTRATVVRLPHGTILEVGEPMVVDGARAQIVALRANGRTWRRPGDRFGSDEVVRAYVRRTESPPAGRRDWSRSRGTASSSARATSIAARSRSSPGTRVTRSVPRARRADGGADAQSRSPP
jgi:uncharacterized Zn finger protein